MQKLFLVMLEIMVWCLTMEVSYQNEILREIPKASWMKTMDAWVKIFHFAGHSQCIFHYLLLEKYVSGSVAILNDWKAVLLDKGKKGKSHAKT